MGPKIVGAASALTVMVAACSGAPAASQRATGSSAPSPVATTRSPGPTAHPSGTAASGACAGTTRAVAYARSALLAIQFVDAAAGWVVTGHGVIATTDGGAHWQPQLVRRIRYGAAVDFLDRDHGWVVADGALLATSDGGQHWTALAGHCPRISEVHFYSARGGYAVTGDWRPSGTWRTGPLLRTGDGGRSWVQVAAPPQPQHVCLAAADHGWLAAAGKIYRTDDGARSWTLVEPGPRHRPGFTPGSALQCSGRRVAWAVITGGAGMSQQAHTAFHLHGRQSTPIYAEGYFPHPGVHTDVSSPGSYAGPFSAVSATTAVFIDYCPACGAGTAPLAMTVDGGHSLLRRGEIPGLTEATGASFVTGDEGWVIGVEQLWHNGHHIGERYRILRTDDSARHWTTQYETTVDSGP